MENKDSILQKFRLDGKTAVVTGGAGNIGYHTARTFAEAGARIAVVDLPRCLERSRAVARELEETFSVKCAGYGCELTDEKAVKTLFDQIEADLGSVDVVHNNAGVGGALAPDVEEWDAEHNMPHLDHWRQVLDINLVSQYIVATTAVRVMIREKHGGSIINTASMAGHIVNQAPMYKTLDDSSYGVSKAGVIMMTKSLAMTLAPEIRVNSVSPGMVEGTAWYRDREGFDVDAHNARQALEIPVGRVATAEDVADTICFLLSDEGAYLTGVNIPIDGGRGERMP